MCIFSELFNRIKNIVIRVVIIIINAPIERNSGGHAPIATPYPATIIATSPLGMRNVLADTAVLIVVFCRRRTDNPAINFPNTARTDITIAINRIGIMWAGFISIPIAAKNTPQKRALIGFTYCELPPPKLANFGIGFLFL
jgi:hypothetical protein